MKETTKKKIILDFLQKCAEDLRKAYLDRGAEIVEARFEENPPRLVMVLDKWADRMEPPKFRHKNLEIVPEIVIQMRDQSNAVVIQTDGEAKQTMPVSDNDFHKNASYLPIEENQSKLEKPAGEKDAEPEPYHHPFLLEEMRALGISETIGPHSKPKNEAAFQAWKNRFGGKK